MAAMTESKVEEWVFWWFCFLELNDDYHHYCVAKAEKDEETCREIESNYGSHIGDMYEDWGELSSIKLKCVDIVCSPNPAYLDDPAWKAWFNTKKHLFFDTPVKAEVLKVENPDEHELRDGHLLIDIPLSMSRSKIKDQVLKILENHPQSSYQQKVIPAKYKLYGPGLKCATTKQLERVYDIFRNHGGNSKEEIANYVAKYGMGASRKVEEEMEEVLLTGKFDGITDSLKISEMKKKILNYEKDYMRYWFIGNNYSASALTGLFPCKIEWLDSDVE